GHIGANGRIVLLGERAEGILLARRFQSVDRRDNIDGRVLRDSLPDFAGETFDVIMDAYNEPYAGFLRDSVGIDSLRESAVRGALFAWDSLSQAKIIFFTSPLHARYGMFDADTLQQLKGGVCRLMTPVEESLKAAVKGGARNIAVWASDPVREAKVYESVFEQLGLEGNVVSITPDPALDICTEFRSLLRQYRLTGRKIDALILDGYGKDPAPLWSEIPIIRRAATEEEDAFSAMLPSGFQILVPDACIVDAVYTLLRKENLFTHRIHRPSVRYFVTEESLEGGVQKVPLSAQYVQSEYVPNIN
ncbi:MAG: hypothetical protein IJU21_03865, partial [Bacteroidales bacterium]|nr:hypothetical protein [Bacteroidales bacterium]